MLITHHNIMACNLELHAIAIKPCFGIQQPHVRCFQKITGLKHSRILLKNDNKNTNNNSKNDHKIL